MILQMQIYAYLENSIIMRLEVRYNVNLKWL